VSDLAERMGRAARVRRQEICDLVTVNLTSDAGAKVIDIDSDRSKVTLETTTEMIARAAEVAIAEVAKINRDHATAMATMAREVDAARAERDAAVEDARNARRSIDPVRQQRAIDDAIKSATSALESDAATLRSQIATMRDELNNLRAQKRAWRKAKP
jgi:hypothetical protein